MYLSEVSAENYRIFGSDLDGKSLKLALQPGLNVLVGENDGGKSGVVDAIRHCLSTTSSERNWITEDDFHCGPAGRSTELTIRCKFLGLDTADAGTFMEWLSFETDGSPSLHVTLRARRFESAGQLRTAVTVHSGERGNGPSLEGVARELLRTTYLRPLRDAEAELSPGRGSRLSQILASHPGIATEAVDDFTPQDGEEPERGGKTLVGIIRRAEHHIKTNGAVVTARDTINEHYLSKLQVGREKLISEVGVASDSGLQRILEKLELAFAGPDGGSIKTRRGLGLNNSLFMAAELLLLGVTERYPLLLVEEPEAHLHPQLQARVIDLLKSKASDPDSPVQVILTTHSPYLASTVPLESMNAVYKGGVFPLGKEHTLLSGSDRTFLERFLDSTKANLFFARGVAVVEGDAENLLIPALAEKAGCSFSENGISVVNVGHTGLFRYSRIFQRTNGGEMPVKVACIKDFDVAPDAADDEMKKGLKRRGQYTNDALHQRRADMRAYDGGSVKSFVSDHWTLEYDLAAASWPMARIMHQAISSAALAKRDDGKGDWPDDDAIVAEQGRAAAEVDGWQNDGTSLADAALHIYRPLRLNNASKAVAAQFAASLVAASEIGPNDLPAYLRDALAYLCPTEDADAAA